MLLSSFNTIKQHFKPQSNLKNNIFQTKQYDYPSPFIQKLYLSYLEVQDLLKTKTHDEIIKRINIVKNDKNLQKMVCGFVYAIILHTKPSQGNMYQKELKDQTKGLYETSFMGYKIALEKQNQNYSGTQFNILAQITQYLNTFRNQGWTIYNNIFLDLLNNYFSQIKPQYRLGFISLFKHLQKFSLCSDDLFINLMKTLNVYDLSAKNIRYNIELVEELTMIMSNFQAKKQKIQYKWQASFNKQQKQEKGYSSVNTKLQQQISLMRHYLFGKLVHWQWILEKVKAIKKSQWPLVLDKLANNSMKLLKLLYNSNLQQCLVFSGQLCRYSEGSLNIDAQYRTILNKITQISSKPLSPKVISHHYNLVPISIEFLLPLQIQKTISKLQRTLYFINPQQVFQRVQKSNVHLVLDWIWKQYSKKFSQQNNKNYLLQYTFIDLVRWCLTSFDKNLQLRCFVIQWILYQSSHNDFIYKNVRQAFFFDWFYCLKTVHETDFNYLFGILTASLHILNYFIFCAPGLAENLLVYILGKNVVIKSSYQYGNIAEVPFFRTCINEILKKATVDGLLRIKEIIHQSQLSNFVKNQLQLRIYQSQTKGLELFQLKNQQNLSSNQISTTKTTSQAFSNNYPQPSTNNKPQNLKNISSSIQNSYSLPQQSQYYGDKSLNINFDIKDQEQGVFHSHDEQDILYSSHQFISLSPSYHGNQEAGSGNSSLEKIKDGNEDYQGLDLIKFTLQRNKSGPKRQSPTKIEDLEKEVKHSQNKTPFITKQSHHQKSHSHPLGTKTFTILLQKQFLEQMGQQITNLTLNPTVLQFTQFIKHLIKILKQYKKSSKQQQMVQLFLKQTTKITYLVFNKQFQSFDFSASSSQNLSTSTQNNTKQRLFQKNLTYFLIKSIHQHWKQSLALYNIYIYKRLVKYLCQNYQSCQFTFYYVFLDMFKKGIPNFKEMKLWLIEKEREKYCIPVLKRLLGDRFKIHIYQNAQALKIII